MSNEKNININEKTNEKTNAKISNNKNGNASEKNNDKIHSKNSNSNTATISKNQAYNEINDSDIKYGEVIEKAENNTTSLHSSIKKTIMGKELSDIDTDADKNSTAKDIVKNAEAEILDFKLIKKEAKEFFSHMKKFLFAKNAEDAKYRLVIEKTLKLQLKPAIKVGFMVVSVMVFVFFIWGILAPLDSASIAPGVLVPNGKSKVIQHLEGGIIDQFLVKDGDEVKANQDLLVLNPIKAKSEKTLLLSRLRVFLIEERRLIAESMNQDIIDLNSDYLDKEILDMNVEEVKVIAKNQIDLLKAKNNAYMENINRLRKQIEAKQHEIISQESMLKSYKSQIDMLHKQFQNIENLQKKGLATMQHLVSAQQAYRDIEGRVGHSIASISSANEVINASEAEILYYIESRKSEIQDKYKEVHRQLLETNEQYQNSKDILKRTVIKSPIDGIISNIGFHTIGGVVGQGMKIMEVVPRNEELVAEVQVKIQDIDNVKLGMETKVQLDAYKQRLVPRISGTVIYISADKVGPEPNNPNIYYIARVRLNADEIKNLNATVKLQAGMPITAFIVEGTRTFLYYLVSPILESFHRAFKEA